MLACGTCSTVTNTVLIKNHPGCKWRLCNMKLLITMDTVHTCCRPLWHTMNVTFKCNLCPSDHQLILLSEQFKAKVFTPSLSPPLPPTSLCFPPLILPLCPEVFVQCHGGRDQTVVHLREAGEAQTSTSSYGEDGCSDQHAHLQRPTTPGKGQHELQHWDDSRVSMTICSPQAKSLLSNISGVVPETRDNGIDGITRFTINHSDMGTLTKHGQLKMAASATQV